MKIIAGLGNPGREYEDTRHNAGFKAIDRLAYGCNIDFEEKKHRALCGRGIIEGEKVLLMKPQTYMNASGESLRSAMDYYKLAPEDIIVIFDDISLEPGQLRIRAKGSAGGHNGIKSVISHLGSENFVRIKVGVGEKPSDWDLADYVLGHIKGNEAELMDEAYGNAAEAVRIMLKDGISEAMNIYNKKKLSNPMPHSAAQQNK